MHHSSREEFHFLLMYITSRMIKPQGYFAKCNFRFVQQLLVACSQGCVAQSWCWQPCPPARTPLSRPQGHKEEGPPGQEKKGPTAPLLERANRTSLAP